MVSRDLLSLPWCLHHCHLESVFCSPPVVISGVGGGVGVWWPRGPQRCLLPHLEVTQCHPEAPVVTFVVSPTLSRDFFSFLLCPLALLSPPTVISGGFVTLGFLRVAAPLVSPPHAVAPPVSRDPRSPPTSQALSPVPSPQGPSVVTRVTSRGRGSQAPSATPWVSPYCPCPLALSLGLVVSPLCPAVPRLGRVTLGVPKPVPVPLSHLWA